MLHPNKAVPDDVLLAACSDILAVLAQDEPEALRRAAATLRSQPRTAGRESPASKLARAWLAFAGNGEPTTAPEGEVFQFTFPAHLAFEVVHGGGVAAAQRVARSALAALDASDVPLGAVDGPLPGAPALLNVTVWAGSTRRKGDRLELEFTDYEPADD